MGTSEGDTGSQNVWAFPYSGDWYGAEIALLRTVEALLASVVRVFLPMDAYSTAPITLHRRLEALGIERGQLPVLRQGASLLLHWQHISGERHRTRIVTAILGRGSR